MPHPDPPIPLRHRLTVRLTAGVIAVLLLIGTPFFLAFHRLLRAQQLEARAEATSSLSRVVADGLRSAMLAGEPHLLDEAVRNLSEQQEVERVLLLDHRGRVSVSSDPAYEGRTLDREQEHLCRVCHDSAGGAPRTWSAVTELGGRDVYRAATAIPNEPRCHGCHDAATRTNGIMLIDLSLGTTDGRFFAGMGSMLALGTVMVLLTVVVLVWLLRRMVHRPLGAVVSASRSIVGGDLDARAQVEAPGEFARLATHVNRMTDHLSRSLRTVETQRRDLQSILDSVDDEIVVLDRERRVIAANRAFRRRSAEPGADLTGRRCHEISGATNPCAGGGPGGCPVERVFESGRLNKGILSQPNSDGNDRVIEIHASPLRGPDGEVTRVVEVRRDIPERRQMEAVLAHSEQLASLGLLASGISHEINNPLGAIATSVEGLRRRIDTAAPLSEETSRDLGRVLERIGREVERGRTITHRLLKVARPPGAGRTLVDVNVVIEDILGILAHDLARYRIEPRLRLGSALPTLPGDESRVGQIVMNVTLNAIQAMGERGGTLEIATSLEQDAIRIEIADTGCGIAPGLVKRIFEPFFTTKPAGKGTGLGLFITHQIVTELGGTIRVKSRSGPGTRVTVLLPRPGSGGRP